MWSGSSTDVVAFGGGFGAVDPAGTEGGGARRT
jgi:hypothetical protein